MVPKRVSLGYVLELVIALAVGLGLTRAVDAQIRPAHGPQAHDEVARLVVLVDPFLVGIALVGGLGLVVESAGRRGRSGWGFGRRTWAITSLYVVIETAANLVSFVARSYRGSRRFPSLPFLWDYWLRQATSMLSLQFASALIAVWLTSRWARIPGDPSPDAREWMGRLFAATVMAWAFLGRLTVLL